MPVSPSRTASGMPPTRVATTGRAAAMASSSELGNPSPREESTETSKRRWRLRPLPYADEVRPGHVRRDAPEGPEQRGVVLDSIQARHDAKHERADRQTEPCSPRGPLGRRQRLERILAQKVGHADDLGWRDAFIAREHRGDAGTVR